MPWEITKKDLISSIATSHISRAYAALPTPDVFIYQWRSRPAKYRTRAFSNRRMAWQIAEPHWRAASRLRTTTEFSCSGSPSPKSLLARCCEPQRAAGCHIPRHRAISKFSWLVKRDGKWVVLVAWTSAAHCASVTVIVWARARTITAKRVKSAPAPVSCLRRPRGCCRRTRRRCRRNRFPSEVSCGWRQ